MDAKCSWSLPNRSVSLFLSSCIDISSIFLSSESMLFMKKKKMKKKTKEEKKKKSKQE